MSSASEDELDALYIAAREAAYIHIILKELGHKQHRTPIQTDRSNQYQNPIEAHKSHGHAILLAT